MLRSRGIPSSQLRVTASLKYTLTLQHKLTALLLGLLLMIMAPSAQAALDTNLSFSPVTVYPTEVSRMTIALENTATDPAVNAALSHQFVDGIFIAPTPNISTDCNAGGMTPTIVPSNNATAGQLTISNAGIPVGNGVDSGSCSIEVDVVMQTAGSYIDTIPAGSLTAVTGGVAEASVQDTSATLVAFIEDFTGSISYPNGRNFSYGMTKSRVITLNNPNPVALTNVSFTENNTSALQTRLHVVNDSTITNTCGGTVDITEVPADSDPAPASGYRGPFSVLSLSGGVIPASGACSITVEVEVARSPYDLARQYGGEMGGDAIPVNLITSAEGAKNRNQLFNLVWVQSGISIEHRVDGVRERTISSDVPEQVVPLTFSFKSYHSLGINNFSYSDALPASPSQMTIVGAPMSNSCGGTVSGTDTFTISGGSFAAGQFSTSCSVTVPVKVTAYGRYVNNDVKNTPITADEGTFFMSGDSRSDNIILNIQPVPAGAADDLYISKSTISLYQGDTVTSSYLLENRGATDTLTNLTLTDTLSGYLRINSDGDFSTDCPGAVVNAAARGKTIAVGGINLPPNSQCRINLPVTLYGGTPGASNWAKYNDNIAVKTTLSDATQEGITYDVNNNGTLKAYDRIVAGRIQAKAALELAHAYTPTTLAAGGITRHKLTATKFSQVGQGADSVSFRNVLPAGHTIAAEPNLLNGCGGTVSGATHGSDTLEVSGVTFASTGSCHVSVDVQVPNSTGSSVDPIPHDAGQTAPADLEIWGLVPGEDGTDAFYLLRRTDNYNRNVTLTRIANNLGANREFLPATINGGAASRVRIVINNTETSAINLTQVAFTDDLSGTGIKLFTNVNPSFTNASGGNTGCRGGLFSGIPGSQTFTASDMYIDAGAICHLEYNATSGVAGNHIATLAVGAVTSRQGMSNNNDAAATLTVARSINIAKGFYPESVEVGNTAELYLDFTNTNEAPNDHIGAAPALIDEMPAGLSVNSIISNTCGGTASIITQNGNDAIQLSGGDFIAGNSCRITAEVSGAAGTYLNQIAVGDLTTTTGGTNRDPTEATLTIFEKPTIRKSFDYAITPTYHSIAQGGFVYTKFTLTNHHPSASLTGINFSDTLTNMTLSFGSSNCGDLAHRTVPGSTPGTTVFQVTNGTIPPGSSCTVNVRLRSNVIGDHPNQTTGVSSDQNPVPGDPSNVVTLNVYGRDYSDSLIGTLNGGRYAVHKVVSGVHLGSLIDADPTLLRSANADGDDLDNLDDEDGINVDSVTFTTGQTTQLTATVNGAGGYLQGWIDFNNNNVFETDEQVVTNYQDGGAGDLDTVAGTITFDVAIPGTASIGQVYARFRWSTTQNLNSSTAANDGEVEDYRLTIQDPLTPLTCGSTNDLLHISGTDGQIQRFNTGSSSFSSSGFSPIGNDIRALGYRQQDGYLYGIDFANSELYRMDGSGNALSLGIVTGLPAGIDAAGMSPDGFLWATRSQGADLFKINVATAVITNTYAILSGLNVTDMAFNAANTSAYFVDNTSGEVRSIGFVGTAKTAFLTSDVFATLPTGSDYGAVWWSDDKLFAFRNSGELYEIGLKTGVTRLVRTTAALSFNDGADCGSSIDFNDSDYSDTPLTGSNYGSAAHDIDLNLVLGTSIDAENSAFDSIDASGDGADDDGVDMSSVILTPGQAATVTATVAGTGGYLQGWIDFDGNGTFDAGEQIAINAQDNITTVPGRTDDSDSIAGQISINFTVPASAVTTQTFARFRWSTTAGLDVTTAANDGEVEDYALTIQTALTPFSCSGDFYQIIDAQLKKLDISNGNYVNVGSPVANHYNAAGYNPVDNFIYGMGREGSIEDHLVKIGSDGALQDLGAITKTNAVGSTLQLANAGDVDSAGSLWARTNNSGAFIYRVDTTTGDYVGFALSVDIGSVADLVYINGKLYGASNDTLHIIDLSNTTLGVTLPVVSRTVTGLPNGNYGAGYTNANNELYFSNNNGGSLYRISDYDGANPTAFMVLPTIVTNKNDGMVCPNGTSLFDFDYSDAPLSSTNYGDAVHAIVSGFNLGAGVTSETFGYDDANADADANDDGININSITLTQGQTATVTATITGAGGYLQGWIDFDGNGVFDTGEQVATDLQDNGTGADTTAGDGTISFEVAVPASAVTTQTFARFRWSTTAGLDATTAANDGEVEDYAVTIRTNVTQPTFTCDGTAYTIIGRPSVLQSVDRDTLAVDTLGTVSPAININGIGYNKLDDYIYGLFHDDAGAGTGIAPRSIIRMGADRSLVDLGLPSGTGTFDPETSKGTMDETGKFYAISDTVNGAGKLFIVDIGTNPAPGTLTYSVVNRTGVLDQAQDLTFSPTDDALYGIGGGNLIRITTAGVGSYISTTGASLPAHPGGAWADASGTLYFYDNLAGGFYSVDVTQSTPVVTFLGSAPRNGQFDATACRITVSPLDYSDAPADGSSAPAGGTTAYGEASHTIVSGTYLGAGDPDADATNQPDANAAGDDNDGNNDDDGININSITFMQGQTATVTATVSGAGGYLQGWIDFDGNGGFDAGEQVAADLQDDGTGADTTAGDGTISFEVAVPADAITTAPTFARFRWSTTAGLDSTTAANDGEVEDYAVTVNTASTGTNNLCQTSGIMLEDFEGSSLRLSSFDNFSTAFPSGTSPLQNSYGTAGYVHNDNLVINNVNVLSASQGDAYAGFHSEGIAAQEVVIADLSAAGRPTLFAGEQYDLLLDAYTFNLQSAPLYATNLPGAFSNPGYWDVFGIRTGSTPTLNAATQANSNTIAAIPGVDLLGSTPLVTSMTEWTTYTISFTAAHDYDRLLFAPRAQVIGNAGAPPYDDPFLGLDNICYLAPATDYSDGPADGSAAPAGGTTNYGVATHKVDTNMQLGVNITDETSAVTDADNTSDDGININSITFMQGQTATVTATVAGAGGYLQGWVDFDGNGTFDAGEQVAADLQDNGTGADTTAGDGTISFDVAVPADAITTVPTFARFRLSTTAGLDSTTAANDGEVEDYAITIQQQDWDVLAVANCPAGTTPIPVSLLQNADFETYTTCPNGTSDVSIHYAEHWFDDHATGGQLMVTNPPSCNIPRPATSWSTSNNMPGGISGKSWMGAHSSGSSRGEGATNLLLAPLLPGNTYVGHFGITRANESPFVSPGYMAFMGVADTNIGSNNSSTLTATNHELLYTTPSTTTTLNWTRQLFSLAPSREWDYLRVEARDAGSGLSYIYFDDFHLFECRATRDYSDAPISGTSPDGSGVNNYGETTHATLDNSIRLGASTDDETTSLANADASGDGADDDGVDISSITFTQGQTATVTATVVGTGGYLQGWIDFDGNGTFDAGEQIATDYQDGGTGDELATNGLLRFTVPVPADATLNQTFARFRWSTTAGLDATTAASDGEVEDYALTIQPSGQMISGRVFNDTNVDGIKDIAEIGISKLPVVLYDTVNGTCVSTRTDGGGYYAFTGVLPGSYQVYEASRETVPTPQNCDPAVARDPSGYLSTTANTSTSITITDADVSQIDFGDVLLPNFVSDNTGAVLPGNVIFYAHTFTAPANGSVTFSTTTSATDNDWNTMLYHDEDCSGAINNTEADAPLTASVTTHANSPVCIINKVFAPSNASSGQQSINSISADYTYGDGTSLAINQTLLNEDITTVSSNPVSGEGELKLTKTVQNLTQATPETAHQNTGLPGDILQYRIVYRNVGTAPLTDIQVNDSMIHPMNIGHLEKGVFSTP